MKGSSAIRIDPEQLRCLNRIERLSFRVTNYLNGSPPLRKLLSAYLATAGASWVEFFTQHSAAAHGFDSFEKIDANRGVLLAVNHRTFYDQFVVGSRLFKMYGNHHNIYFPVRANFFYDNLIGLLGNLVLTQGVMYPPIVRDRRRLRWNQAATGIMVELLKNPANMVGIHPEGTRNQGEDPYEMLPAKPGCGELIYRAKPNVVPVFILGFPDDLRTLRRNNKRRARGEKPLVHMVMGEPMDFSAELAMEENRKTFLLIARKVMVRIGELGQQERQIRAHF